MCYDRSALQSEGTFPDEEGTEMAYDWRGAYRLVTVKEPSPMKRGLKYLGYTPGGADFLCEGTFPDEEGTEILP